MLNKTKYQHFLKKNVNFKKVYDIFEALYLFKKFSDFKFVESIDVSVNLNIDQNIRNFTILPHGTGRKLRIALFTHEIFDPYILNKYNVKFYGTYDLVNKIKNGCFDFDIVVSDFKTISIVNNISKVLLSRKLMPNVNFGTLTENVLKTIKNIKIGYICYRNDKNGIIHTIIGKTNFSLINLKNNLKVFLISLKKNKSFLNKNVFIKKIILSTTMGFSLNINLNSLLN